MKKLFFCAMVFLLRDPSSGRICLRPVTGATATSFFAIVAALAACVPQSTPIPLPAPSLTQTLVAATATTVPPSATIVPATSTRAPATVTLTTTPTVARPSTEPPLAITLILKPEPNSVTATFTARGNQSDVELNVKPGGAGIVQSAVIFEAFCNQPGIVRYALTNIVNGKSVTTLNVPLATLLSGALILDVRNTTRPSDGSLACAAIPEVLVIKLEEGTQPGTVIAFDQTNGPEVDAFIKPGPPGVAQPALIREGKCNDLGAIRYSLNPIVDGASKTFFGTRFADFRQEMGALNVHKSIQELDVSVACGLLAPGDAEGRGR